MNAPPSGKYGPLTERDDGPAFDVPDRIAIDGGGYGWRVFDGEDGFWSMVPTTDDNDPIRLPVTYFVPEDVSAKELLGEVVDWLGVPGWPPPPMSEDLGRRIARCLEATDD